MNKEYKFGIWDIIIWISLLILIIYIIAKLIGIINTPDWINLIPVITLVFFAGAFYQKVIGFMERMFMRTDYLKEKLDKVNNEINNISSVLKTHNKRLFSLERRIK